MGQFVSDFAMDDDGPDILSMLADLFQCFGIFNMFERSRRRKKRKKKNDFYNGFQQKPQYKEKQYMYGDEESDNNRIYDNTQNENSVASPDVTIKGILKPEHVLGKTGSTMYDVEVIQPDTYQKWHPKHKAPKSKVIIQLEPFAEVWTMWQQVDNDLCVFGIPTALHTNDGKEEKSFLYVTVVTLPVQVNNSSDKIRVVRLMPSSKEPIKNSLEPDDPRLFKMDYLEKSGNRKLYHIASLSYLGIEDNDLCLTDSRNASVWKVKEHKITGKSVKLTKK